MATLSPKATAALGGSLLVFALGSAAFVLKDTPGTDQGAAWPPRSADRRLVRRTT